MALLLFQVRSESLVNHANFVGRRKELTLQIDGVVVILLEIGAAFRHPVQFKGEEFIRVGSYKKKLKDHPEKERGLWWVFDHLPFGYS